MVRDICRLFEERRDLRIKHVFVANGPDALENYVDEAVAAPFIVKRALEAQEEGADGVIVNCMADPALRAVREALAVPVTGLAEPAMHTAAMLGQRFGVIDVVSTTRTLVADQVARYGLNSRYGSFRSIEIPVLEIEQDPQKTAEKLVEAGIAAVREDAVDTLILGCGTLLGPGLQMERIMRERGMDVAVINPMPLAINTMAAWIASGLRHSKLAYPMPRQRSLAALRRIDQ